MTANEKPGRRVRRVILDTGPAAAEEGGSTGILVRRFLGANEVVVRRAFGEDAINALVVAASHRQGAACPARPAMARRVPPDQPWLGVSWQPWCGGRL